MLITILLQRINDKIMSLVVKIRYRYFDCATFQSEQRASKSSVTLKIDNFLQLFNELNFIKVHYSRKFM